ncbi:MAG: DUF1552 domain-containing protein [Proteobacteria bacterium]|nr:MAG: DUF1552 domain-containing protein [Pseudomonadota bacterium]
MERRNFLRGATGVFLALPFLEGLAPKKAMSSENDPGRFAVFMRQANGVVQNRFWPTSTGVLTDQTMVDSNAVSTLKSYKHKLLILKGVSHPFEALGCNHAYGGAQALTAAKPISGATDNLTRASGESIDNLIARTFHPNVEPLTLYAGRKFGYLDEVLSYRSAGDIRSAEQSPYRAYLRLFGRTAPLDGTGLQALRRKSVNDFVRSQMNTLMSDARLSAADRIRLDLHQSSIRDFEKALSKDLPSEKIEAMKLFSQEESYAVSVVEVAKLHMDLIGIAIASGHIRTATLQVGSGNDASTYRDSVSQGLMPSYHRISHRIDSDGEKGEAIVGAREMHMKIDVIHGQLFAYLLDVLSTYKYDSKTLLDFGVAVWLNDIADGPTHSRFDIPHILAGSCNGVFKQGLCLDVQMTNNRLLNSIGSACGLKSGQGPLNDFGDSSLPRGPINAIMT